MNMITIVNRFTCQTIIVGTTIGSIIVEAKMGRVSLKEADLSNLRFSGLYIGNIDLQYADFTGAELCDTNLSYANLHGANFTGADLSNCRWNNTYPIPNGWQIKDDGRLEKIASITYLPKENKMSNQNESPESIIIKFPSGGIMNISFYYGKQPNNRGDGVIAYNHDVDWACGPGYDWQEALNNCISRTNELKGNK